MSSNAHTSAANLCGSILTVNLLVQDLHHGRLLFRILNQHAASPANIFDDIDDLPET
jgi:hypothetical protein